MKTINTLFLALLSTVALSTAVFAQVPEGGRGNQLELPHPVTLLLSNTDVLRNMNQLAGRSGMQLQSITAKRVNSEAWDYIFSYSRHGQGAAPEWGTFTVTAGGLAWRVQKVTDVHLISPAFTTPKPR